MKRGSEESLPCAKLHSSVGLHFDEHLKLTGRVLASEYLHNNYNGWIETHELTSVKGHKQQLAYAKSYPAD